MNKRPNKTPRLRDAAYRKLEQRILEENERADKNRPPKKEGMKLKYPHLHTVTPLQPFVSETPKNQPPQPQREADAETVRRLLSEHPVQCPLPAPKLFGDASQREKFPKSHSTSTYNVHRTVAKPPQPTNKKAGVSAWNVICGLAAVAFVILLVFTHEVGNSLHAAKSVVVGQVTGQPYRASIESYLRSHANDPSSVDIVNLGEPMDLSNGIRKVTCTFRAKNGFGALVLDTWNFMINSDNEVVSGIEFRQ